MVGMQETTIVFVHGTVVTGGYESCAAMPAQQQRFHIQQRTFFRTRTDKLFILDFLCRAIALCCA